MIEIRDLWHKYRRGDDEITALRGVNLTVNQGEFVVVLGHNGSGKSTLAKHLNALLLPTSGSVYINGMDTKEERYLWEIRQQAGMVFQNPDNQLVATVVEEDVAFGPENLGLPPEQIRERVREALALVGMSDYRHYAPHLLSGGQKQRVAIAGIIAMRPSILILDEPTAMLDPQGRKEVMDTVKRLNREEGLTVVHITHFMEEAAIADRVVVMEQGKIVMDGTPRQVFSQGETLKKLRLDVPQVVQLAQALRAEGVAVPENILTVEQMLQWVEQQ